VTYWILLITLYNIWRRNWSVLRTHVISFYCWSL